MFPNNWHFINEMQRQHSEELLKEAEHYRLVKQSQEGRPCS